MPEDLLGLWVFKWEQLEFAALLQGSFKIPQCLLWCALVETRNDGALKQTLSDVPRNVGGTGDP